MYTTVGIHILNSNMVNEHHNNEMRRFENTHGKRERVKLPLLPNRVGKRSGTMTISKLDN